MGHGRQSEIRHDGRLSPPTSFSLWTWDLTSSVLRSQKSSAEAQAPKNK